MEFFVPGRSRPAMPFVLQFLVTRFLASGAPVVADDPAAVI